jgi:hypothetical protein
MTELRNKLHRNESYKSDWWSIALPAGWVRRADQECTTFTSTSSPGALQVSAARKPNGAVTIEDLQEFASNFANGTGSLQAIGLGAISGITAESVQNGRYWKKWWLKKGSTIVFLTYNIAEESKGKNVVAINRMISTVTIRD